MNANPTFDGDSEEYIPAGEDQIDERLAALDDDEANLRAETLRAGLSDYELDDEDAALLAGGYDEYDADAPLRLDPVVAIVGRPNVGKSTLVNRILGRREAVVEDTPGVTRDRVSYPATWNGVNFTLVDTGGWEHDARGIHARVADQAEIAVDVADAVMLVVDATVGITATDEAVVRMLRSKGKPVIVVANKVDDIQNEADASVLWGLASANRTRYRHCMAAAPLTCWTPSWTSCPSTRPTVDSSPAAVRAASH